VSAADDSDDRAVERVLGPDPGLGPVAILLKLFVSIMLFALMVLTCIDVIGRYGFNSPVPGASELIQFGMGLMIFGALPLVTVRGEHVSIELMSLIAGDRARLLQSAVMRITSLVALALMSWQLWARGNGLMHYSDSSIYLGVPLAPFAYFMSVMSGLSALALLLAMFRRR
jgi:TRAP-type transport system small permease protein